MKTKIVSDGTPEGTHVEDENGNRFTGVKSFSIDGSPSGIVATVRFVNPGLEIVAPKTKLDVPKAQRQEFAEKLEQRDSATEEL